MPQRERAPIVGDAAIQQPLIKTSHTADTLALALRRQQRWLDRHVATEQLRMAKARLREGARADDGCHA